MKRWLVILSVVVLAGLGVWCWLYRAYDRAVQETLSAAAQGLHPGIRAGLDTYEQTRQGRILTRIRMFSERIAYLRAIALANIGEEQKAGAAFTQLTTATQSGIAERALYNKALQSVRTGALEEAIDQYRKALVLDPDDLQAKINLELLLVRMQGEKAAGKKQGEKEGQPTPVSDYWTREENKQDGPSTGSKRIWK